MAERARSERREPARVPRNHLPQPVHSSAGSTENRADSASALQASHPPLAARVCHGYLQGKIVDAISIRERPAEVEDRAVPGHWEGDLLRGTRNSHVATLVERHWRFCMLVKVPGKDTATVVAALSRHVRRLPATLRRSLTWDRGLVLLAEQAPPWR